MFDEAVHLTSVAGEHTAYCLREHRVYLGVNERFVYWSCQSVTLSPCEDSWGFVLARHGRSSSSLSYRTHYLFRSKLQHTTVTNSTEATGMSNGCLCVAFMTRRMLSVCPPKITHSYGVSLNRESPKRRNMEEMDIARHSECVNISIYSYLCHN
jgi:hypothetical protein